VVFYVLTHLQRRCPLSWIHTLSPAPSAISGADASRAAAGNPEPDRDGIRAAGEETRLGQGMSMDEVVDGADHPSSHTPFRWSSVRA
jgi:hypothetical protein